MLEHHLFARPHKQWQPHKHARACTCTTHTRKPARPHPCTHPRSHKSRAHALLASPCARAGRAAQGRERHEAHPAGQLVVRLCLAGREAAGLSHDGEPTQSNPAGNAYGPAPVAPCVTQADTRHLPSCSRQPRKGCLHAWSPPSLQGQPPPPPPPPSPAPPAGLPGPQLRQGIQHVRPRPGLAPGRVRKAGGVARQAHARRAGLPRSAADAGGRDAGAGEAVAVRRPPLSLCAACQSSVALRLLRGSLCRLMVQAQAGDPRICSLSLRLRFHVHEQKAEHHHPEADRRQRGWLTLLHLLQ